jgi:hypothetical protein
MLNWAAADRQAKLWNATLYALEGSHVFFLRPGGASLPSSARRLFLPAYTIGFNYGTIAIYEAIFMPGQIRKEQNILTI